MTRTEVATLQSRARRAKRKAAGICVIPKCALPPRVPFQMCEQHAVEARARATASQRGQRDIVFKAYGDKCWGCGITDRVLLTLDHRYFDGAKERKAPGGGPWGAYRRAIREGFPERYRLLCWNCQHLARMGYIPEHEPGA